MSFISIAGTAFPRETIREFRVHRFSDFNGEPSPLRPILCVKFVNGTARTFEFNTADGADLEYARLLADSAVTATVPPKSQFVMLDKALVRRDYIKHITEDSQLGKTEIVATGMGGERYTMVQKTLAEAAAYLQ